MPVGMSNPRIRIAKALRPVIIVFAALYFLIDAIFFSLIKPLGTWLSKLPIFVRMDGLIRSLGLRPIKQALIQDKGHFYDAMTVVDPQTNQESMLYFNVDKSFNWQPPKKP